MRNFNPNNESFLTFQVFAWKIHKARNQYRKRVDIGNNVSENGIFSENRLPLKQENAEAL